MKQSINAKLQYRAQLKKVLRNSSLVMFMAIMISACGFHLRGDIVLPALYERVHIVTQGYSNVGRVLSEALENAGSKIVSSPQAATAVVTLLSSGTQRKALNVGGKTIREYELQLDISFVVQDRKGTQLAEQQTVTVIRNFQNDSNDVLAKDNEEQIIRREMMQPAIFQILRRMKALAE